MKGPFNINGRSRDNIIRIVKILPLVCLLEATVIIFFFIPSESLIFCLLIMVYCMKMKTIPSS